MTSSAASLNTKKSGSPDLRSGIPEAVARKKVLGVLIGLGGVETLPGFLATLRNDNVPTQARIPRCARNDKLPYRLWVTMLPRAILYVSFRGASTRNRGYALGWTRVDERGVEAGNRVLGDLIGVASE